MSPCPALWAHALLGCLVSTRDSLAISDQIICTWASFLPFLAHDCWCSWNCLPQTGPAQPQPRCAARPELPLGCGRSLKSSYGLGKGATTSPWFPALLLSARHTGGRARRSLKLRKGALPLGTECLGRGIRMGRDSAPGLGLPPQLGSEGSQRMGGCRLCRESPYPIFPPLGTTVPCLCSPTGWLGSRGMPAVPMGSFPLCDDSLVLLGSESPQPGPSCSMNPAIQYLSVNTYNSCKKNV